MGDKQTNRSIRTATIEYVSDQLDIPIIELQKMLGASKIVHKSMLSIEQKLVELNRMIKQLDRKDVS